MMTIGGFAAILAFAISVVLNRKNVDHFWCFAVAIVIPLGLIFLLMQSHMSTGSEASKMWLEGLLLTAVPAALGFLFRKKSVMPEGESKGPSSK